MPSWCRVSSRPNRAVWPPSLPPPTYPSTATGGLPTPSRDGSTYLLSHILLLCSSVRIRDILVRIRYLGLTDPDPSIRLRILVFSLGTFKTPTKNNFFCLLHTLLFEDTFSSFYNDRWWWLKDPDPDPYLPLLWLTDPNPGGPKTYGSGSETLLKHGMDIWYGMGKQLVRWLDFWNTALLYPCNCSVPFNLTPPPPAYTPLPFLYWLIIPESLSLLWQE